MQTAAKTHLSPKQLAHAVGVSESSIKRWADEGRISIARTAGGHRRIALEEALRFVRDGRMDLAHPDVLGLAGVQPVRAGTHVDVSSRIRDLLLSGDSTGFRAALASAYLGGESIAALCDGPLRDAMITIGERWTDDPRGIFEEHRATALACTGLVHLALMLPLSEGAPVALGGALRDDQSQLSSLMVATVLGSLGFEHVNLGANTPARSFLDACDAHTPVLVCVTVNHAPDIGTARTEIEQISTELHRRRIPVVLGGRASSSLELPERPGLHLVDSMVGLSRLVEELGLTRANRAPEA